jgi:hypothetical protein
VRFPDYAFRYAFEFLAHTTLREVSQIRFALRSPGR